MNIHEYQGKAVLKEFGAPVSAGFPALTVAEAVDGAKKLPGPLYVVKSQIHAGGRGKGKFKEARPPTPRAACAWRSRSKRSRATPRRCSATRW